MEQTQSEGSTHMLKLPFNKNVIEVRKVCQSLQIKKFYMFPTKLKIEVLENKFNMGYLEIISLIEEQKLSVNLGVQTIFSIPIGFFTNLYGLIQKKNKIKIPLDFKMFFANLIFNLEYQSIYLMINFPGSGLQLELGLDIEITETQKPIPDNVLFQHIQPHNVDTINQFSITTILNHNLCTKGFFIKGNLDSIYRIKFLLNGQDRFDYDQVLLNTICTKINDGFFYIPLDMNEKFTDCGELSYCSSLNLSRIDTAKFNFVFKTIPQSLIIYSLSSNYIKHVGGFMGLRYSN
jgi:hypothetical protein